MDVPHRTARNGPQHRGSDRMNVSGLVVIVAVIDPLRWSCSLPFKGRSLPQRACRRASTVYRSWRCSTQADQQRPADEADDVGANALAPGCASEHGGLRRHPRLPWPSRHAASASSSRSTCWIFPGSGRRSQPINRCWPAPPAGGADVSGRTEKLLERCCISKAVGDRLACKLFQRPSAARHQSHARRSWPPNRCPAIELRWITAEIQHRTPTNARSPRLPEIGCGGDRRHGNDSIYRGNGTARLATGATGGWHVVKMGSAKLNRHGRHEPNSTGKTGCCSTRSSPTKSAWCAMPPPPAGPGTPGSRACRPSATKDRSGDLPRDGRARPARPTIPRATVAPGSTSVLRPVARDRARRFRLPLDDERAVSLVMVPIAAFGSRRQAQIPAEARHRAN